MADSQAVSPFTPDLTSDLGFGKGDIYFLKKGSWSSQALLSRLEMCILNSVSFVSRKKKISLLGVMCHNEKTAHKNMFLTARAT